MTSLAFILGREPELSIAEIAAVFGDDGADWVKAELSAEVLVVPVHPSCHSERSEESRTSSDRGPSSLALLRMTQEWMARLGGTVKIGEVWREVAYGNGMSHRMSQAGKHRVLRRSEGPGEHPMLKSLRPVWSMPEEYATEAMGKFILEHTDGARKTHFGYSVYDLGAGPQRTVAMRKALTRGVAAQKSWLTEHGRKVRWVTSRAPTLSSVIVAKNHLLPEENGVEVLVLITAERIILARTLAVQPFAEWGMRDYGKPRRSMTRGMLPPKLARIMVNIGISNFKFQISNPVLLDPFCGTGTVLLEALDLGHRVIGSDLDPEAIQQTRENIAWWSRTRGGARTITPPLFVHDATRLHEIIRPASVDTIVTEPTLGPTRGIGSQASSITHIVAELHQLYVAAFASFARILNPGDRVVFVAPVFRTPRGERAVEIADVVARLGFRALPPFPPVLARHPALRAIRHLDYARPGQRIGRRIHLFERT